jgi:hypothetical protein
MREMFLIGAGEVGRDWQKNGIKGESCAKKARRESESYVKRKVES